MSCLLSWPESIWLIMIHTARIVLALLIFGTWWYFMSENVGFEAIWILLFYSSTVYITNKDWDYEQAAAECKRLTGTSGSYSVLKGIALTRGCSSFSWMNPSWSRGKKATKCRYLGNPLFYDMTDTKVCLKKNRKKTTIYTQNMTSEYIYILPLHKKTHIHKELHEG